MVGGDANEDDPAALPGLLTLLEGLTGEVGGVVGPLSVVGCVRDDRSSSVLHHSTTFDRHMKIKNRKYTKEAYKGCVRVR